jgi:SPP1 family predicted phage head-tail adaptor
VHIGKLDKQAELFSQTETNNLGSISVAYTSQGTVWGYIYSARGDEAFEAARVNAKETIRLLIRYRDDVTVKWRVAVQGQTYNIKHVDRSQRRNGELWLTCEVVSAV